MKAALLQFCNIFAGLTVSTGRNECGDQEFLGVPITVGSRDRVVAALQAGNTQNKPFSLPIMSANMTGLNLSPNKKGTGVVDRRVYLPAGGVFPNDLKTVVRVMPIPYIMNVDLSIYASNSNQMHQILEQLLMLFDPTLQIQTSDAAFDWTKIASVELVGINNEENFPPGGDRRIIVWSLQFVIPFYISVPIDIKDEMVRKIFVQIGNLDGFQVNEFDENGQMVPFEPGSSYGTITVDRR
jgi:hypothetical protein